MPETIGFLGLGKMGLPMASRLLDAGFELRVYNRSADKARPLADRGVAVMKSPAEVSTRGGIVISVVSDDPALESLAGDDLAEALGPGGLHISMSTVSPAISRKLAAHHSRFGAAFLAAPVFGRPEAAGAGKLFICASGAVAAKQRAQPAFKALGQRVFDFGEDPGAANVVKLGGNFLIIAAVQAMAEASALAEKNGVPRAALLDMLTQTLFACPIYQSYSRRVIDADFEKAGFRASLALKDVELAVQTAADSGVPMPTLSLLREQYLAAMAKGRESMDATVIALEAAEAAGLKWGS